MEVAGVVLGAIPLIFYALDNYHRAWEPLKDTKHWKETIQTIRTQVELQRQQLKITLSALDLELTDGTTMDEIEFALQVKHPSRWEPFMISIRRMDGLMNELAQELYPDAQGPPNMSDATSDRMNWEWRRVKRSFGSKRRREIFTQLQACNTALQNCGLERREAQSDTENRIVNLIRARFDEEHTRLIRENARTLHQAIKSSLGCTCPVPKHLGHIQLNWHEKKPFGPGAFALAMSSVELVQQSSGNDNMHWRSLSVRIEQQESTGQPDNLLSPPLVPLSPTPSHSSTLSSQRKSRGVRFRDMFRGDSKRSKLPTSPANPAAQSSSTLATLSGPTPIPSRSPSPQPTIKLCDMLQVSQVSKSTLACISVPGTQPSKQVRITSSDPSSKAGLADPKRTIRLHALLNRVVDDVTNRRLALDRKQRFGIAAGLAWAVLHLCNSAWMGEVLNDEAVHLFLEQDASQSTSRLSSHPYLSYSFTPPPNTNSAPTTNQFQSKQIQNITLYTLAIRLIELGLNKSFDKLRLEAHVLNAASTATTTPLDDYDVAKSQITELMLDPGMSYAHAVDRCLRFLFPGPTSMNTFEHRSFRSTFFADVVAPIQATYELIPTSVSEI